MTELSILTVSAKGQIVLPKATRCRLGVKKGTKLLLIETKNGVSLRRVSDALKNKLTQGLETMIASESSLAKDWNNKEDSAWDNV
ncbi:MAG: AbrB/MazE/SpoVT family DNA-binding domain-containing protein [Candidatus Diapherotrites archaeon]|nr:AbrB/MazE/SpoVT family DNA-binding domain-containing protein [Candidatus Diapherotrites archaeon]